MTSWFGAWASDCVAKLYTEMEKLQKEQDFALTDAVNQLSVVGHV